MEITEELKDKLYHFQKKVMRVTVDVIQRNVNRGLIKNQMYVVQEDNTPIYVHVKGNEYDKVLEQIKNHYIEDEQYEECSKIVEIQNKIKELQNATNTRTVKSEL